MQQLLHYYGGKTPSPASHQHDDQEVAANSSNQQSLDLKGMLSKDVGNHKTQKDYKKKGLHTSAKPFSTRPE